MKNRAVPTYFPFSAFLGFNTTRRALLCTLVNPLLHGLLLSGPSGTGKSALIRSFARFVHHHIDPDAPFTQIPLGITDDRLIGGIDLDSSLSTGTLQSRQGLLADAHNGFLFIDDMPLLDTLATTTILAALEAGNYTCERETISATYPSRFLLLGTATPSERQFSISIADRVAFLLIHDQRISNDSVQILLRILHRYSHSPQEVYEQYREYEEALAEQVANARALHPLIEVPSELLRKLATTSQELGVSGNRADIFAAKAARAHAALRGSREIEEIDLQFALTTVLMPRAENIPDEMDDSEGEEQTGTPPTPEEERKEGAPNNNDANGNRTPGNTGETREEDEQEAQDGEEKENSVSDQEQIFEPLDFDAPLELQDVRGKWNSTNYSGGSGNAPQWRRGRHTRSVQSPPHGRRIAIAATLRAAAPHQKRRKTTQGASPKIRPEDIRVKKFTRPSGTLFIFCVDASGSMAMNRMREAKGAVTYLLQQAYINRDTVSLIALRGAEAEVLLPPTSSVEHAKRSLDILPTGGGTPLASALLKAYSLAERAKRQGTEQILIVCITDGRANVALKSNAADMIMDVRRRVVREELEQLALAYRNASLKTIVIDTKQTFGTNSEAGRLAELLGGRYYYLPLIHARELASVIREAAE